MNKCTIANAEAQAKRTTFKESLDEIIRKGAQQLLTVAVEAEVKEYLERYKNDRDKDGHRLAVRNGYMPEREIMSSSGPITIRQPRVDD